MAMRQRSVRERWLEIVLSAFLALTFQQAAAAESKPFCSENVIRLVVPFAPGGPVDSAARLMAEPLRTALSQTVIVESRPGASGSVGAAYVAQQPGNGCTILISYDTQGVNPALYPHLPFDTLKDFKSVMLIGTVSNVVVVHPSQPWKSFDQFVSDAKKTEFAYATGGVGSLAHLTMKILEQDFGFHMRHVPYRGGSPAVQAVIGGHVPVMIGSVLSVAPAVQDNRIRALVQTGLKRDPLLPGVPTLNELGRSGFNVVSWLGVFMPAATSAEHVVRLNKELVTIMHDATIQSRFSALGVQVVASSPQELQTFLEKEVHRWTDVVKRYDIKAQ
jgi:tripartite-type tricarboxylate transporter receptor subunit TctC